MRADQHDGLVRCPTSPAADQIAGRVDLDLEPERAHPIGGPCVGGEQLAGPGDPRDAPLGSAADLRQLVEARGDRTKLQVRIDVVRRYPDQVP